MDGKKLNKCSNRQPTVILVTFTLQGGGAERFVLTMEKAFRQLGYEVHIICFKNHVAYHIDAETNIHFLNYQAFRWMPRTLRNKMFAWFFDRYIKKSISGRSPSLILSNLLPVDSVLQHSRLSNITFVIHNTTTVEHSLKKLKGREAEKTRKKLKDIYQKHPCIAVSRGVADDIREIVGKNHRLTFIHNPIDRERIIQLASETIAVPEKYLVHVGSFKYAKGHDLLLKAYANSSRSIPLVLVGDGGLKEDMVWLAKELGIADRVIFSGFRKNPYPYIKKATAMVLSSRFEGFGLVIAEAQALGTPVISADCPSGPSELLPENNLVPNEDINALTEKINRIMSSPCEFLSPFDKELLPEKVAARYMTFISQKNLY